MESLAQDLRLAVRSLRKSPLPAAVAVVSLGLGIGANTAVFSLLNATMLRPLGVAESDRLVSVFTSTTGGQRHGNTSYPDYLDYRERNDVFSGLAAHTFAPMSVRGASGPRVVMGQLVSWDYFDVLGVRPALGRGFLPEENRSSGTHPVAVLSHGTWRRDFAGDPDILGATVRVNDFPLTVVGVAPAGFRGLLSAVEPALWAPLAMAEQVLPYSPNIQSRIDPWLQLVARLESGVSHAGAQARMDALAASLATTFPEANRNKGVVVEALERTRLGTPEGTDVGRRLLLILLGAVGLVLLVACFNVANLQLARALGREREIALRRCLGASRWRVVRHLLAEGFVLALLAGAVGLGLAIVAIDALPLLQPRAEIPLELPVGLDGRVLAFTLGLATSAAALFALAPALQLLRVSRKRVLSDQGSGFSPGRRTTRLQSILVGAQVALSLVLLTAAGLLTRSFRNTLSVDPGFDLENGLIMPVNLGYGQYDEREGRALQARVLERVAALPGVESAALTAFMPLGVVHGHHDVYVEGYEPAPDENMLVKRNMVSTGYVQTMGIRLIRGRAIDEGDRHDTQPVAMVNETMARRFWPGGDPVGRTVRADMGISYTVIGIVEDGKYASLLGEPEPYLLLPLSQSEYVERVSVVVATRGSASSMRELLQAEVRRIAPDLPHSPPLSVPQYLEYAQGNARAPALLLSLFGVLALLLGSVGLFGLMSYAVRRRTREFGVRIALGATEASVAKMVLGSGLRTTLLGVAAGLLIAVGVTRVLSGLLYDVSPLDPLVFALAAATLVVIGQVASYLPARLASRADPVAALKDS